MVDEHLDEVADVSGGIEIQVSKDRLTARASRIDALTTDELVLIALESRGICFGVNRQVISDSVSRANSGQVQHGVAVARGSAVKVLEPAIVEFRGGLEETASAFDRLLLLMQETANSAFSGWSENMPLVRSGDVLAELVPARFEPGVDVFGEEILPDFRQNATFRAGQNVSLSEDGTRYLAQIYGYAGIFGGELMVVSPVWVAPDLMEACFVCLPADVAFPPTPTSEEITELLAAQEVRHGIDEDVVFQIGQSLEHKLAIPLVIAQGTPAVRGEHAQVKYAHNLHDLLPWNQL